MEATGILLVGGASSRFGAPKPLARIGDETLAERAWRLLDAFPHRIAVGKVRDGLALPFDLVDDGTDVRAPLAGLVAGLRAAPTDVAVVVPVDCPGLTASALNQLAEACRDAAVPPSGPLPGAYRRTALPTLERRLAAGELKLRDAVAELDVAQVDLPANALVNVNAPPYTSKAVVVDRHPERRVERDLVAVEEPLEIRIAGEPVAVTMRTPGNDEQLALGFAIGEGLEPLDAAPTADLAANTVDLDVRHWDPVRLRRNFYTSSSCGVCGKGSLDAVAVHAPRLESSLAVGSELLASLPDRLREAQPAFELTGGLHAAGLFDRHGDLLCVREDVGRHNALDKVVGWAFRRGMLPLADRLLCVSGRLSFELVQKAAAAGCPVLVGVGAPSSLAVELAAAQGLTLAGWARRGRVSVYAGAERVR